MREELSSWYTKFEDDLPPPEELTPISQSLISTNLALAFNIQQQQQQPSSTRPSSTEFDSSDESARTLKRPRLVWTPQLHKRFVDAVAHLGIKNAVPKTIMHLMSVDGLTRENVASHLQKYRLYLKRMQGIGNGGGPDPATDRLFASHPIPAHFLAGAGGYVPAPAVFGHFPAPAWGFGGGANSGSGYVQGFESGGSGDGRRVLTLFPSSE